MLRITDDRGRRLAADGTWTEGDATVTTGADGRVTVGGVDSGVLTVEEVAAPEGYAGFTGSRALTLAVEGLDVEQVAAARPTLAVSAAEPLRVDGADAASGTAEATVLNSRKPSSPSEWLGGLLPKTGEGRLAVVLALAVAGVLPRSCRASLGGEGAAMMSSRFPSPGALSLRSRANGIVPSKRLARRRPSGVASLHKQPSTERETKHERPARTSLALP